MFTKFIKGFLTKEECDYIIRYGESIGLQKMLSSKIVNGKVYDYELEYAGNKRMGCYFIGKDLTDSFIDRLSNRIISLSNELNPFKSIEYTNIPKYSFNRYSSNDFLDWHEDKHEIINGATITYIIQLNDDYNGGYVRYLSEDGIETKVPKEIGSVLIFDSNISHSVDVVDSGVRYSLNVWPGCVKTVSLI